MKVHVVMDFVTLTTLCILREPYLIILDLNFRMVRTYVLMSKSELLPYPTLEWGCPYLECIQICFYFVCGSQVDNVRVLYGYMRN